MHAIPKNWARHATEILPEPEDMTGSYVLLASRQNNRPLSGVFINADCGLGIRGLRQANAGFLMLNFNPILMD